jgi:hypothetical protein
MRYLFGFMCVLALGVMGCGETTGTGGSGGDGGSAGIGGVGGSAGEGGQGGNGGVVADCTGVEDFTECMPGDVGGFCVFGECAVLGSDCSAVGDETFCLIPAEKGVGLGLCSGGDCLRWCAVVEEGAACHRPSYPWELGECGNGSCIPFCENDEHCFDYNDCTADTCLERGLCEFVPVQNGTPCFDEGRTCQSGECVSASP